jgi:ParB/RepB/Spo0J family partition protein
MDESIERLSRVVQHGQVRPIELDQLSEAATNPNSMAPESFAMLKEAIRRAGFLQPVLVRTAVVRTEGGVDALGYEIIDGHHRVAAARELAYASVPCVVVEADDATTLALRIGMNRMRGELNLSAVAVAMGDLQTSGWKLDDMSLTGFSADEAADLLASLKLNEDDVLGKGKIELDDTPLDTAAPMFLLEIHFTDRAEFKKARAGLKRAAGKSADLGKGLLRLLGE